MTSYTRLAIWLAEELRPPPEEKREDIGDEPMPEPKVRRYEEALWLEEEKDLLMAG